MGKRLEGRKKRTKAGLKVQAEQIPRATWQNNIDNSTLDTVLDDTCAGCTRSFGDINVLDDRFYKLEISDISVSGKHWEDPRGLTGLAHQVHPGSD